MIFTKIYTITLSSKVHLSLFYHQKKIWKNFLTPAYAGGFKFGNKNFLTPAYAGGFKFGNMKQISQIQNLESEENRVLDMAKKGIIPEHLVKKQLDELENNLTLAKMEVTEMHGEELDVTALILYAENFGEFLAFRKKDLEFC